MGIIFKNTGGVWGKRDRGQEKDLQFKYRFKIHGQAEYIVFFTSA